ncbi:MAG: ABC transporter substrate-binding protein [Pseudomonadota bacterium]
MSDRAFINRRTVLTGVAALPLLPLLGAAPAAAQGMAEARALVDNAVAAINRVIASGQSEAAMIRDFEQLFVRYADVPLIAQSVLGPPARSASQGQLRAFTDAFQGYIARKYGRRFREFIGGSVTVVDGRPVRNFYEVITRADIPGERPFELRFLVSNRSGQTRFFNLIIEGVNLMITERTEIGALLDRSGGDLDRMIATLRQTG